MNTGCTRGGGVENGKLKKISRMQNCSSTCFKNAESILILPEKKIAKG